MHTKMIIRIFHIIYCLILLLLIVSCDNSVNGPISKPLLGIQVISSDSAIIKLDNNIIYNGKLVYSGILGTSYFQLFENEEMGVHNINYKSYRYNKEATYYFYLEDSMTVSLSYNKYSDEIYFGINNYIIYPE